MKTVLRSSICFILTALILISCSAKNNNGSDKQSITIAMAETTGIFNPLFDNTIEDSYISKLLFDDLLEIDKDGKIAPDLAKYEANSTFDTYKFTLKNAKFTNGENVTSKDVLFTFKILCDSTYMGMFDMSILKIKGFDDYNSGKTQEIEGIKIIDDKTIEFNLSEPNPSFAYNALVPILPASYYSAYYEYGNCEKLTSDFIKPMGSGQYEYISHEQDNGIVLTANKDYFKGNPKIKQITISTAASGNEADMLLTGEADLAVIPADKSTMDKIKNSDKLMNITAQDNSFTSFCFNLNNQALADVNVRKALSHGIDRQGILSQVYGDGASVINLPLSKASKLYYEEGLEIYGYDLGRAEQILDVNGWVKNSAGIREKNNQKLSFNFVASQPNPVLDIALPVIVDDMKKIGIEIKVESVDYNTFVDNMLDGKCDIWFFGLTLTPNDLDALSIFASDSTQNYFGYSNTAFDEIYNKAYSEPNEGQRNSLIKEAFKVINQEDVLLPFYQRDKVLIYNKNISNINMTSFRECFDDFYLVKLK